MAVTKITIARIILMMMNTGNSSSLLRSIQYLFPVQYQIKRFLNLKLDKYTYRILKLLIPIWNKVTQAMILWPINRCCVQVHEMQFCRNLTFGAMCEQHQNLRKIEADEIIFNKETDYGVSKEIINLIVLEHIIEHRSKYERSNGEDINE